MHAFKHGELVSAGRKVRDQRQAIAIGLSEAGASRDAAPQRREADPRVDGGQTRAELLKRAAERGIRGRSRMTKVALRRALGQG